MNTCQKLVQLFYFGVIVLLLKHLKVDFVNSARLNDIEIRCFDKERNALLKFKDELVDEIGVLSSWGTTDDKRECCIWRGVSCDNQTNHVVALKVTWLKGKISSSLLELENLSYLDLSGNDFNGTEIPAFIGSLSKLQHLDLTDCRFGGSVPKHLGNLSHLQFLRLQLNPMLKSSNLKWLSQLHSLSYLDLSLLNLKEATDWFQAVTNLPHLQELHLMSCQLQTLVPPSLPRNVSNSLSEIDLSNNEFSSTSVLLWIFNLSSSLTHIDLNSNNLKGPIPDAIGNTVSLESLDLGYNMLEGAIPTSFWNLSNLKLLSLTYNRLNGTLAQSMGNLSKLMSLNLDDNQFQGVITEAHLFNLSQLQIFSMLNNPQISFSFSSGWIPPFQLNFLFLDGCKVGPNFPTWLRTQKELTRLEITNAGINDTFPSWFWELISPNLIFFNISHNNIHGVLPDFLPSMFPYFEAIDLSYNDLRFSLPILPKLGTALILSNNKFSGPLTISCNETGWVHLDLSNNLLSGDFPSCLANMESLEYLNLANNNFSGQIPSLNLSRIFSLHLQSNSFRGEILASLKNSTLLKFIDLSKNKYLTGIIPEWLGDKLPELVFLSLHSNNFSGSIPSTLCHLAHMQVLDISVNNISGAIPKCLKNLTAMVAQVMGSSTSFQFPTAFNLEDFETAEVTWKGGEHEYHRTLNLVKFIDLSSNNLQGEIPLEITSLEGLVGLNLSRNNLTGILPPKIGQLTNLNFLDLSRNHLCGEIPASLSHLDRLGVLDLSYNNFSGRIPWNNHLETFNSSSYVGNIGLCGPPLTKLCPEDETDQHPEFNGKSNGTKDQKEDKLITPGYYISMAIGFIFGFWGIIGTLLLNHSLRYAFFRLWSNIFDWLYIEIAIIRRHYNTNS